MPGENGKNEGNDNNEKNTETQDNQPDMTDWDDSKGDSEVVNYTKIEKSLERLEEEDKDN